MGCHRHREALEDPCPATQPGWPWPEENGVIKVWPNSDLYLQDVCTFQYLCPTLCESEKKHQPEQQGLPSGLRRNHPFPRFLHHTVTQSLCSTGNSGCIFNDLLTKKLPIGFYILDRQMHHKQSVLGGRVRDEERKRIRSASQREEDVVITLLGWAGRKVGSADVVLSRAYSQPL